MFDPAILEKTIVAILILPTPPKSLVERLLTSTTSPFVLNPLPRFCSYQPQIPILYARCLRETGERHPEGNQAAAQTLVCQTLFGAFQLDSLSGLQMSHQVMIVQWQQGQRRVVWPPEQAECPLVFSHPT